MGQQPRLKYKTATLERGSLENANYNDTGLVPN